MVGEEHRGADLVGERQAAVAQERIRQPSRTGLTQHLGGAGMNSVMGEPGRRGDEAGEGAEPGEQAQEVSRR